MEDVYPHTGCDYVGNFYYGAAPVWNGHDDNGEDRGIIYVFNAEGFTDMPSNRNYEPSYNYYRRDHLGNNREVWRAGGRSGNALTLQRTQYYPSGLPWVSNNGDGPGMQPFKFNGCELIEEHGYDVTDLGNRGVHHATNSFTTIDRFAEKFPWQSPYVHAGNNPVNFVDVNGDSIMVLNMGSGTNQHMGLLIQNSESGKWQYFSLNGDKIYNATDGKIGGGPTDDTGTKEFNSPEEFMNSPYNTRAENKEDKANPEINGYGYTEGYILPTTQEEDNTIRNTFMEAVNEGYNLVDNQCSQAVQKSLNAIGIKTTRQTYISTGANGYMKQTNPYLPSEAFKAIKTNNPQGILIPKR